MSGSEKLPLFEQLPPGLRYLGQSPFGCLPTAAGVLPRAPNPFIAHIYPWAAATERQNRGLNRFPGSISQPATTAALVALAASRCVDKNLSVNSLLNFTKQSIDNKLSIKENPADEPSSISEVPPKKKSKLQFDVDARSETSPTDTADDVTATSRSVGLPYTGSSTFPTEWQQFFFRCRSFDNFDGTVNLQSNIGNIRNWSLANRRNRFLSESSNSTSFGRSESGELMPSINGSRDHDACTNQTTRSSPSDDVMKSPWHSDHLSDKGRKLAEMLKKSSGFVDPVKSIYDDVSAISSNRVDPCRTSETLSDDSIVSTNKRCSSTSSDQSRDEINPRPKRKRAGSLGDTCPVCGISVRACDMENHVEQELEKIEQIPSEVLKKYVGTGQTTSEKRVRKSTVATSSMWASGKKNLDLLGKTDRSSRFKTYEKVRSNRLERLNTRVGRCLRSEEATFPINLADRDSWPNSAAWSTHFNLPASCPVCCSRLVGSQSAMHDHISRCLRQKNVSQHLGEEETDVDVENEANLDKSGCEGGWSSKIQTPFINASPVKAGSLVMKQRELESESEKYLNVEVDDTQMYGPVQYAEEDLLRVNNQEEEEKSAERCSLISNVSVAPCDDTKPEQIVNSLQCKITKLEDESRSTQCMICMSAYKDPVTSIQCWHVHCERCWLQALRVKKLCPQCNSITPLNKLRRIFL